MQMDNPTLHAAYLHLLEVEVSFFFPCDDATWLKANAFRSDTKKIIGQAPAMPSHVVTDYNLALSFDRWNQMTHPMGPPDAVTFVRGKRLRQVDLRLL